MFNKFTLNHPDMDEARGRTRELIDELMELCRSGKAEGAEEILAVASLLRDGRAISNISVLPKPGNEVEKLAKAFVDYIVESALPPNDFLKRIAKEKGWMDVPLNCSCLGNATGAIFSALRALGIDDGEVITTSLNYMGVVNAIELSGAHPKFVDVDPDTWCMDLSSLESAINKKTRAIVLTHVNEYVDLEPIYDLLKSKRLDTPVIQDASLAVGSTRDGLRPGLINLGERGVTVMSLANSKIFCGFGGAVFTTHDLDMMNRTVTVGSQGVNIGNPRELECYGANVRARILDSTIAIEQLKRRDELLGKRREVRGFYEKHLKPAIDAGKISIQGLTDEAVITHYFILMPDRARVAQALYEKHNIAVGIWHAHHMQEIYRKYRCKLPVTESIEGRFAMLPFHTKLEEDDVAYLCKVLIEEMGD